MQVVVVVSADGEWRALNDLLNPQYLDHTPFGETFFQMVSLDEKVWNVRFVQGGWGKIAAAASAQYIIDHYEPDLLINLGTCGGFAGLVETGVVLVVEQTIVYDIYELMGDPIEHLAKYTTKIDLSWLGEAPFCRVTSKVSWFQQTEILLWISLRICRSALAPMLEIGNLGQSPGLLCVIRPAS